jgi:predicted nucleotidyltransferase
MLQAHDAELRELGVLHVDVFGSVARGEATAESDVDLLVDFDEARRYAARS